MKSKCCPDNFKPCRSCLELGRREFLRIVGLTSAAIAAPGMVAWGAEPIPTDFELLVPSNKNLSADWIKSLFARGTPKICQGEELKYIGMPVAGICTGQVYLAGDGRLWLWDIFNHSYVTDCFGHDYVHPMQPEEHLPFQQGFALQITQPSGADIHPLNLTGFPDLTFRGEYPIGTVEYKNTAVPLEVTLSAYSPFIPLNADDSGLPAIVMSFTVKNSSTAAVEAVLAGWLQNAALLQAPAINGLLTNQIVAGTGFTSLNTSVGPGKPADQPDILFEDWHNDTYGTDWTAEGTAFGSGPIKKSDMLSSFSYMGDVGGDTDRVVNSHASSSGTTVGSRDDAMGKLTSKSFPIARKFITFWIGGGRDPEKLNFSLMIDGKKVLSATGDDHNSMTIKSFDVGPYLGKTGVLEIVDAKSGGWGNIGIGRINFTDSLPVGPLPLEKRAEWGTMALTLLGDPAEQTMASGVTNGFDGQTQTVATAPVGELLVGGLGRKLKLAPGDTATVNFLLTWNFPNLSLGGLGNVGRYYATKYKTAADVSQYVVQNFDRLSSQTKLWRDTWYDSTLPYWFLDRSFANTSTLSTGTPYRFADGRFYSWEGVGSCPGTCTHVWGYGQAMARIFPELERDTRERVDLGIALSSTSGVSGFRAEFDRGLAVDGQAMTIMRCYREHQMSADTSFLTRNWSNIKKMFDPLLSRDPDGEGILQGGQMNTLDQTWYGKNSWQSSLYLGALRAGEAMALEMGDSEFATKTGTIAKAGFKNMPDQLFNGEYFANIVNPDHLGATNSGTSCEIDQVLGQSWAFQVGLPRVLPAKQTQSALASLWKYNFSPDVGVYKKYMRQGGRPYALPGEAGLLMCTFPRPDWSYDQARGRGPAVLVGYFNECMSGFEHQVAGHMIWEGMVQEGLAVIRAIDDRYAPAKRNPYDEIECGNHYSRAMASYGVFVAACGYEHHGPLGHLGFAPRLTPENFRAPFTVAEGWGTYAQTIQGGALQATVGMKSGKLQLKTLALQAPAGTQPNTVSAKLNNVDTTATLQTEDEGRLVVTFNPEITIPLSGELQVTLS
jgi:non-lysosomal glucosylceramidase